jgi:hypothetical protein
MRYRRWRQLLDNKQADRLKEFDSLMERLAPGYHQGNRLPFGCEGESCVSPLGDALTLMAVKSRPHGQESNDKEAAA